MLVPIHFVYGSLRMKLMNLFTQGIKYLSEAVGRIFAPSDDHYPATGVVPFFGDPYYQSVWID